MRISSFIDHTVLKQTTTETDIKKLVEEAVRYQFAAVCVPPTYVSLSRQMLGDSGVNLATVIGFPFGYHLAETKSAETASALNAGANEIDMVINVGALRNGDRKTLSEEIKAVLGAVRERSGLLKVIIESGILTNDEILFCCELYGGMGVDFMKTSTGFAEKGASTAHVQLMRANLPSSVQIKASGGIRDLAFARELVNAGATRLGCSASVAIVKEEENEAS